MLSSTIPLPHFPALLVVDRFDVLESTEDEVQYWQIVQKTLARPVTDTAEIVDIIETLSVTLHGHSRAPNYDLLLRVLAEQEDLYGSIWPTICRLALDLPSLHPTDLVVLQTGYDRIQFSRRQVASLLAHQFLCTLLFPPWMTDGSPDFSIWYCLPTPHPNAVEAYLFALFKHFSLFRDRLQEWPVVFTLRNTQLPTIDNDGLTSLDVNTDA